MQPINVATVTEAIAKQLAADERLADATIERSAEINDVATRCPWIGIYRSGVEYPLRILGMGAGARQQRIEFAVFVQHSDGTSGEDCEIRLEQLIADVISVLLSDTTLGNTVDTLDEFAVRYLDYTQTDGGGYMQTASIYFTAITATR